MFYRILLYVLIFLILLFGFSAITASSSNAEIVEKVEAAQVYTDPLFERIAWCESKNDAHAKNPYSTASGRFQFLWSSWNYYGKQLWGDDFYEKNVFNFQDNTELAKYVYDKYGTGSWDASADCWRS